MIPTETWVPALAKADAEKRVIELLSNNGGCRLPCFWGFYPQQVNQQSLASYFHAFHNIGGIKFINNGLTNEFSITWEYNEDTRVSVRWFDVAMVTYRKDWADYVFDDPNFLQYTRYYSLANILSTYGAPSEVYVEVDPGAEEGWSDVYSLFLDYTQLGWSVYYFMGMEQKNGNYVGCPEKSLIELKLWDPEDSEYGLQMLSGMKESGGYRPLEEATSISLEEFYERYKDPNNHVCLETPIGLK